MVAKRMRAAYRDQTALGAQNEAGKQFRRSRTTYIYGHREPLSNGMPRPKMPEPASTITLAIQPDGHRATAANLRSCEMSPRIAHAEQGQEPELGEA